MFPSNLRSRLPGKAPGAAVWRSPGAKHQGRIQLLVFLGSAMVITGALCWGVFFALRGQWLGVAFEIGLVLSGLAGVMLAVRGRPIAAGFALLIPLLAAIWGACLILDIPTPGVPRAFHHLLPALGACAFLLLRGRPVFRSAATVAMFLSYVVLDTMPLALFDGRYNLPDDLRILSTWSYNVVSMLTLYMALHIMQADVAARNRLEADLRDAVIEGQFVLHYQPQVCSDGRVTGAEALVRWNHPVHGMVPPGDFIALAEHSGLIVSLGDWVLKQACSQLAAWSADPRMEGLTLSVNVSAQQVRQPDFVEQVMGVVARCQVDPRRLKLELTESMLVNDLEDLIAKMTRLKREGVGFSLDDFGTGYSSLAYLRRLPLDELKIDQAFVRELPHSANDAAIAGTVVSLGKALQLAVVAEGVETEAQRAFLMSIGCHGFQGYLFSKPVPVAAFEAFVAAQAPAPATALSKSRALVVRRTPVCEATRGPQTVDSTTV